MRRFFATLPLIALLAFPTQSAAQIADGFESVVQFHGNGGAGSYDGVYLPFYQFTVADLPGMGYNDFLCVDNLNYISFSTGPYNARFTSVETGDLETYTREGSDQVRDPLNVGRTGVEDALTNYRIAAYLYMQAQTATDAQLALIQRAAWYATRREYVTGNNSFYQSASTAVDNGWTADNFYVVTATGDMGTDPNGTHVYATGGIQEYLFYVPVPEPASLILLATSLLGLAMVGRRRRVLEDF